MVIGIAVVVVAVTAAVYLVYGRRKEGLAGGSVLDDLREFNASKRDAQAWKFKTGGAGGADLTKDDERTKRHRNLIYKRCRTGMSIDDMMEVKKWSYLSKYDVFDAEDTCQSAKATLRDEKPKDMPVGVKGCKAECTDATLRLLRPCRNKKGSKCCMAASDGKLTNCILISEAKPVPTVGKQKCFDKDMPTCPKNKEPKCDIKKKAWVCPTPKPAPQPAVAPPDPAATVEAPVPNPPRDATYTTKCWRYDHGIGPVQDTNIRVIGRGKTVDEAKVHVGYVCSHLCRSVFTGNTCIAAEQPPPASDFGPAG